MKREFYRRLVAHVNRKNWWHVPPASPDVYKKRGKFLASSFAEAEFYGRPLDKPQKVAVTNPLVGDERAIAKVLRILPQRDGMTLAQIAAHDARWMNAALKHGYDAILLMSSSCYAEWKTNGKLPRSMEINIVMVDHCAVASRDR